MEISRQRYCFANLVAESNLAPYDSNSQEPWQFVADSPTIKPGMDAALASVIPAPEGFVGHFEAFGKALLDDTELPITLADARRAIELLTALYGSARTGAVVNLPIGPDHPLYGGWLT